MTVAEYTPSVERFVALRRSVADLQRSATFYCDGLGFEIVEQTSGEVLLSLGAQCIVLVKVGPEVAVPQVSGPDLRFQHVAIVASGMHAAHTRLQKLAPVAISRGGPQRLPKASGGACAFKFRDPDGHAVELIEFPAGQGAACLSAASQRHDCPTLGIDHAAISVSNADLSIAFYEQLGFSVQSRQINRGVEQARLDGLTGAEVEVEVVALVPPQEATAHLELLAYHTPVPTRSDTHAQAAADRLVWQAHAAHDRSSPTAEPQHKWVITDRDGHLNWLVKPTQETSNFSDRTKIKGATPWAT